MVHRIPTGMYTKRTTLSLLTVNDNNIIVNLTSIARGVLAQSPEPEAHDKVLGKNIQIELKLEMLRG